MKPRYDNSDAAGAVITLVSVFLLSAILFLIIGYGVDRVVWINNALQGMPSSQLRYDTLSVMLMTFRFEPMVVLVGAGLNTWIASVRTFSGEVDLSGMLQGVAEMIILTLAVIALTMFGGIGIEFVINMVNTSPVLSGGDLMLYQAVQYVAPTFYGICFIGLLGAVIQFILQCVQVIDYGQMV